ncbi:hypothetical protein MVEG_05176 [Podila verticillata NRRL 6337]|nr:hypothetical protein MVEG_05176 [Podila verticillata NRRL 6337]
MDYLLPLWLRQYMTQRQKRDPLSLAHPQTHSIQQSFALIALEKNSRPTPSSSSSASSSTTTTLSNRSKFPFTSTTSLYRKVTPQDLSSLNSQEIVRVAIYVMKRSHLDFADPFSSEKVHTAGEEYSKQHNKVHPMVSVAADIYLSNNFNIGKSVLHNPSYPLRRPLESAVAIATFCAKASGGLRSISSLSTPQSPTPSSIAGAKWLAKLGQIIFGGPCSHAGHSHHRRTRASLELLERPNIELGKQILAEEQQRDRKKKSRIRPHSINVPGLSTLLQVSGKQSPTDFYPLTSSEVMAARGSEQNADTLSRSTSNSTLSVSSSTGDKWCKHCSRAVACLVLVAQQEASKSNGEDEYVFDHSGFGTESAFERLDLPSATSSMLSSPSTPQLDFRPRLRSKNDELDDPDIPDALPYIVFDHSHQQHHEGSFPAPSPPNQSSNTNPSQQRKTSSLEKSLADAFSSEFATDSLKKDKTKLPPFIPRLMSRSNSNSNNSRTHSPSLGSDVELVSRATSSMSLSSSGQGTSLTSAGSSPHPIPAQPFVSPSFSLSPPKTLLERDLAEAIATDNRLPFTGIINTGRRLSSDLGLHPKPSLDSIRESVSRSNSGRSSLSSVQSLARSPGEAEAAKQDNSEEVHEADKAESEGESDKNVAHVDSSEAEETSDAEKPDQDKEVALEGTLDSKDKEDLRESGQSTPSSKLASLVSSRASSPINRGSADESKSENASHQTSSISTRETSPSHSLLVTSTRSPQSLDQDLNQTKEPERVHRPFYALGLHGQTPTDAYATEIEESIQKGRLAPNVALDDDDDDDDENNSSASHSLLLESSTVLTEPSEGSDREQVESEESDPDRPTDDLKASSTLSSDKDALESGGSSPRSPGSLSNSGNENDQDGGLEDEYDEENDDFDPLSPVSTKPFTSSLRPMSSISSISTLTDDYLTTGSSEDDHNNDYVSTRPTYTLEGNLTSQQQRALEEKKRRRHRRQQLVDDAQRKQEQLDRIKAQLELRHLGKIRQQVSFWEEKGVLEQRVVSVEEVELDLGDN